MPTAYLTGKHPLLPARVVQTAKVRAQQLVCQRHQARGRHCYEYMPFKLILLTNIQANYWWGQMHCGPPNQNFGWAWARPTLQRPPPHGTMSSRLMESTDTEGFSRQRKCHPRYRVQTATVYQLIVVFVLVGWLVSTVGLTVVGYSSPAILYVLWPVCSVPLAAC